MLVLTSRDFREDISEDRRQVSASRLRRRKHAAAEATLLSTTHLKHLRSLHFTTWAQRCQGNIYTQSQN